MTSKNDILRWLELEEIRLNQRITESQHTNQETISLSGSLLTVQVLLKSIRGNKVKEDILKREKRNGGEK